MQINPFGFPLGAGMQSAPAFGPASLGFADALGLAIEGGAAPQLTGLVASTTLPRNFGPELASKLLVQAQSAAQAQPMLAAGPLPGLQQPTSLSELMATAAKLPTADPAPVAEVAAPGAQPVATAVETAPEAPTPAMPAQPAKAPTQADAGVVASLPQQAESKMPSEAGAAAPAEMVPAKPQKGPRTRTAAAEAEPVQPNATQPAIPAEMLVAAAAPQPVAQPQVAPREAGAMPQNGTVGSTVKKAHAGAHTADAPQIQSTTGTPDFARAVAAQGESKGSEANADGQPQPEVPLAAVGKHDAAAPAMPHMTHGATAAQSTNAAPPTAAEPIIDARAGHLGHSLGVEIARKVELGEDTLRIRLNPIELGRIEVTLAFDDKGSLQATVRTESAQTMDLLRQDAPDLARTLDQAGVRTDAQSFRFENRTGDGGGQQAQQQHNQNRGQFASSEEDAAVAEPIYRPVRSDGQVDLLA